VSGSLTTLIILMTAIHVAAFVVWMAIRLRPDKAKATSAERVPITPCAVCNAPATHRGYDGLDPHEQRDPYTGRPYSTDMSHYQPLCAAH
jgi:hypothetical protein